MANLFNFLKTKGLAAGKPEFNLQNNLRPFIVKQVRRTADYSSIHAQFIIEEKKKLDLFGPVDPTNDNPSSNLSDILVAMQLAIAGLTHSKNTQKQRDLEGARDNLISANIIHNRDGAELAVYHFVNAVQKHSKKPFHFHTQPKSATVFFDALTPNAKAYIDSVLEHKRNPNAPAAT